MDKIGVLTLYHVRNIGACLQAYAMKQIMYSLNREAVFIKGYDWKFAYQLFKGDLGNLRPWNICFQFFRECKFRKFFKNFEEIEIKDIQQCKTIIIGSDSVWIAKYGDSLMPSCYFGKLEHPRVHAYAPSVGGNYSLQDYSNAQLKYLNKFGIVGVRDDNTKKFYVWFTQEKSGIVAVPTLLYDWNELIDMSSKPRSLPKGEYILVYGGFSPEMTKKIKKIGEKQHIKVVNVGIYNRRFDNSIAVSPIEFLHFVKNAKFIITSMFHGVMISIALLKEFRYVSMDKNRDIKLKTTLEKLGLLDNMIDYA